MANDGPSRSDHDDKIGDRPTDGPSPAPRQGVAGARAEPERSRTTTAPPPTSDDRLTETIRARLEHLVPELVRKTVAAGLGAVSSTEEGIRKMARDVSLPDVAAYIASSADGARGKVWDVIARETREFLSTLNLTDELAKVLTTLSFEIKTEVRFIPNSERLTGSEPDVRTAVRVKRSKPDDPGKSAMKDSLDESVEHEDAGKSVRENKSRLRFWRRDDSSTSDASPDWDSGEKPQSK